MSDYAIINLTDVEDSVAGRLEGLEGRFARKHLGSRELGISRFTYAPGTRGRGHSQSKRQRNGNSDFHRPYLTIAATAAGRAPSRRGSDR